MAARDPFPENTPDAAVLAAVDEWVSLLETGRYDAAFEQILSNDGAGWTPESLREEIEAYGLAKPGQRVTLAVTAGDLEQRKTVQRFARNPAGDVGHVCYDLCIDGRVTDLTATFHLRLDDIGMRLVLEDVHVL